MLQVLEGLGIALGTVASAWTVLQIVYRHLQPAIEVTAHGEGQITVRTSVENKLPWGKRIAYAFLLVGPEDEPPESTATAIAKEAGLNYERLKTTNDLILFRTAGAKKEGIHNSITDGGGRWLIPLPYYYWEQVSVGDEKLTYRSSIDYSGLQPGKLYSVRFYVFSRCRLHRSVQDLLVL